MKYDWNNLLQKQALWQRSRAQKPWIEKLRESVRMRDEIGKIRKALPASNDVNVYVLHAGRQAKPPSKPDS